MSTGVKVLVTGAGGFIGSHLVTYLKERGYWVRGVDIKHPEFAATDADEFLLLDLRRWENCQKATAGMDHVYALAADMGGMGFISCHHAQILYNNSLINLHTLEAAREAGVKRYLYTSSACIYPEHLQEDVNVTPLKESDAYPAYPQDAYGWEKLVSERLCYHYTEDYGMETRTVRFHNIFGENGTWDGGREKAPAALCRKIAIAKLTGDHEIEIWGDGEQTRSFCYIDDCVEGLYRLMYSDHRDPINLGQDRMISINELADIISDAAGISVEKKHIDGPQGVRGRNSDNSLLREVLKWEPSVSLEDGLARTYKWIEKQVSDRMNSTPIKVEVVTPVHNRKELTLQCLKSFSEIRSDGLDVHVIVVDDGSTDGTSDAIKAEFPDVQIVEGDGNLWYTEGTNVGVAAALEHSPDYILLMNDDQVFDPEFLMSLVRTAQSNPRSVVGGLLVLWDDRESIFQVSPQWNTWMGGWRHWYKQSIHTVPDRPWKVDIIVGNCMLVPADAFREAGLMDSANFPMYGDAEFTPRLRKMGWQLLVDPAARVYCQPNTLPPSVREQTVGTMYRTLITDLKSGPNLRRRFNAYLVGAPNKIAGIGGFVMFLVRSLFSKNHEKVTYGSKLPEIPLKELFASATVDARKKA